MATPKRQPKPRVPINFKEPRFYVAPHRVRDDGLTVKLPPEVAGYLGGGVARLTRLYFICIDGTVQISAEVPALAIPVNTASIGGFVPQSA